jgi:hypothetical protein
MDRIGIQSGGSVIDEIDYSPTKRFEIGDRIYIF